MVRESPMTDAREAEISRSWTLNADSWAKAVRTRAIESRRLVTDDAVVEAVLSCGGTSVLDVGCGEGWLARRLAREGLDVLGFDGNARLIERAREQGGAEYLQLEYGAFAAHPDSMGVAFDVAVANFALLGESIDGVLCGLRVCVKPNGRLVVQTVHPANIEGDDGWREERYEPLAPLPFAPMPWYFRTRASWGRILRDCGWRVEAVREPINPATRKPASLILIAG